MIVYAGIAVAVLVAALSSMLWIKDQQYVAAKEEATAREAEARSYELRLTEATKRAKTLNVALTKLAGSETEIKKMRGVINARLREVQADDKATQDWVRVAVPDTVAVLMRNRRSRSGKASPSDNSNAPVSSVPASKPPTVDERRLAGPDAGLRR